MNARAPALPERSALLLHPAFLIALTLLIANDWLFKPLFHNALTGKLSDFAGLFAFAFFWSVVAGRRIGAIHLLSGIAFAIWKSPLSQPAIDAWNGLAWNGLTLNGLKLMTIGRVVDATDLLALLVLPLSWRLVSRSLASAQAGTQAGRQTEYVRAAIAKYAVAAIALVAFTATSKQPTAFGIEADYLTAYSTERIVQIITDGRDKHLSAFHVHLSVDLKIEGCERTIAGMTAHKLGANTVLRLNTVAGECGSGDLRRETALTALDSTLAASLAAHRVKEGVGILGPAVMLSTPAQTCPPEADRAPRERRTDANGEAEYPPKTRVRQAPQAAEARGGTPGTPASTEKRSGD